MRHGESENNVLNKLDKELYKQNRSEEPALSSNGEAECLILGTRLKEMDIKINHMFSSA